MNSIARMLKGRKANLRGIMGLPGYVVTIKEVKGVAVTVDDNGNEEEIDLERLLLRAEGMKCAYHPDEDAVLVYLNGEQSTPVCYICADDGPPIEEVTRERKKANVVPLRIVREEE